MDVAFSIVGDVAYKRVTWGSIELHVVDFTGVRHEITAHGRMASRVDAMVCVNNAYRFDMGRHTIHGLVICGVERV